MMAQQKKGIFISIEGTDGSGKSTQIQKILDDLSARKLDVVFTREPGGTPISEEIRQILLSPEHGEMCAETEMLLYAAARAQHVRQKILPALAEGKVVLSDRFLDSSIAYQGYARGLGEDVLTVNQIATGGLEPDLTIFLDLPPKEGIRRKQTEADHTIDRLEQEDLSFHEKVYQGYLEMAKQSPHRVCRIDASASVDAVFAQVKAALDECLARWDV